MAGEREGGAAALADLRREIDRIDAEMHGLLMERGLIIDRLIAAKGTAASGSAFRPEREAAMTRILLERHRGVLPVEAVEGIWRVIISTFTHVQAPFRVHVEAGEAAMRDSARYHFGFTVPLETHPDAEAVVAAVAASRGDLGLVAFLAPAAAPAWWEALRAPSGPKIIARLPFGAGPGHPAGTPVLVVSRSASGEGPGAVVVYAVPGRVDRDRLRTLGGALLAEGGSGALAAVPRSTGQDAVAEALGAPDLAPVGSYPDPIWRED